VNGCQESVAYNPTKEGDPARVPAERCALELHKLFKHRALSLQPWLPNALAPTYVIDLTHYLNAKGSIAPERGTKTV